MNNFFDYLLNENLYWYCSLNNSLDWDNLLSDYLNLSVLYDRDMDNFLNDCWFFYLNYLLSDNLLGNKFRNLDNSINNFFDNSWYFNYLLCLFLNNNDSIVVNINIFYNLNWDMHNFLYFHNLRSLNNFLHNLFNWNYLRNFNNSVYNLFNNFLHLYYFRDNSEDF